MCLAQVRIARKTFLSHGSGGSLILAKCLSTQEQVAALMQQQMRQESQILATIHQLTQQMQQVRQAGVGTALPSHPRRRDYAVRRSLTWSTCITRPSMARRPNMTSGPSASSEPFVRRTVYSCGARHGRGPGGCCGCAVRRLADGQRF